MRPDPPTTSRCDTCGRPIPADAHRLGLCPHCLMSRAIESGAQLDDPSDWAPSVESLRRELAVRGFDVLELLGQGGMGAVYRARQRSLDRDVAIKLFPRTPTAHPADFAALFELEARTLAHLTHPNIVAAHDFGQTDGHFYLVMEFVAGRSLRQALAKEGPMPPAAALDVAIAVCDALQYAHERGVVHRDIKPENILLQSGSGVSEQPVRVRVADFGLANIASFEDPDRPAPIDRVMGTPRYMPPEQRRRGARPDPRMDVYAVGVMLREMLGPQAERDAALAAVIARCTNPNPAARFASAAQLQSELQRLRPAPSRKSQSRRARYVPSPLVCALILVGLTVVVLVIAAVPRRDPAYAKAPLRRPTTVHGTAGMAYAPPPRANPNPSPTTGVAVPPWYKNAGPTTFPPFEPFRPANWDDQIASLQSRHGADRVATVYVDNLPGDVGSFVQKRLIAIAGDGANVLSSKTAHSATLVVAPAADLRALAAAVDFGAVTSIDDARRIIRIQADPVRLPKPLPPEITSRRDPNFYPRNIADLSLPDFERQHDALRRLLKAGPPEPNPTQPLSDLRGATVTACQKLLADRTQETALRRDAAELIRRWSSVPDAVRLLAPALEYEDFTVRLAAMNQLVETKSPAAADLVAAAIQRDGLHARVALAKMGPALAEPPLIHVLRDRSVSRQARTEACRALQEIGTTASLPALQEVAQDPEFSVRNAAQRALIAVSNRTLTPPAR